jgi:hypothetical protein
VKVEFDVYSAAARAIVMRAAEELEKLYQCDEDAEVERGTAFPAVQDNPVTAVQPTDNGEFRQSVVATGAAAPVANFIEKFREQAHRIGTARALAILRDQFGVSRATELFENQQAALIDAMSKEPNA